MEQGRLAAYHAFGEPTAGITALQPIGIYSIPEVSYVGATEVELTRTPSPTRSGCRATANSRAARRRRLLRHAEAAGVHRGPPCSACTSSAPTPPRWCTSARPPGWWRHGGVPGRRGVQLPHVLRGHHGGRARRDEQDAGAQPVPHLDLSTGRRRRWARRRRGRWPGPRQQRAVRPVVEARREGQAVVAAAAVEAADHAHRRGPTDPGAPLVPSTRPPHRNEGSLDGRPGHRPTADRGAPTPSG